eukprot:jgi/Chrzof1/8331/Cz03g06140.t1
MSICLAHHLDAVSICRASPGIRFSRQFHWECVVRTTKHRETDGVAVFAKVHSQSENRDYVVVIAQWRAPIGKFVLELPAGLIESGETIEQVALRELKEETGYTGRLVYASPEVYGEPGFTDNSLNLAVVEIDGDLPENKAPVASPEVGEVLQTLLLPLSGLSDQLIELKRTKGWEIDSRLFALALGLKFGAAAAGGGGSLTQQI